MVINTEEIFNGQCGYSSLQFHYHSLFDRKGNKSPINLSNMPYQNFKYKLNYIFR